MRWLLLLSLVGCESGTSEVVELTVPSSVSQTFSETARGLVVVERQGEALGYVVLCGQPLPEVLSLVFDRGFGCLGSQAGTTVSFTAWAQPLPVAVSDLRCAAQREFYEPIVSTFTDGGMPLRATPDSSWPRGTAAATWVRDFSPCGGLVKAKITLAVP